MKIMDNFFLPYLYCNYIRFNLTKYLHTSKSIYEKKISFFKGKNIFGQHFFILYFSIIWLGVDGIKALLARPLKRFCCGFPMSFHIFHGTLVLDNNSFYLLIKEGFIGRQHI